MRKAGIFMTAALIINIIAPLSYCQEELAGREIRILQGVVSQIDWVGRKITVRYVADKYVIMSNNYQEITFLVTDQTKVTKGTEDYFFSNIERVDNITVGYYINDSGMPTAVSINVNK